MATTYPFEPILTVEDFLKIRFAADQKAELSNGVIRMMAGGKASHARVQANISGWLLAALRGSGCRPYGPDMGVRTHDLSLRYPDVSVFCGREDPRNDELTWFDDPKAVFEILSSTTRDEDFRIKLREYREVPSLEAIVYIDPDTGEIWQFKRETGSDWVDEGPARGGDVSLPGLDLVIPNADIFARD